MSNTTNLNYMLLEIDPNDREDVKTITRMHIDLLKKWGPMAQLGRIFLRHFSYTVLVRNDLMRVVLSRIDGKPAGFIAFTPFSTTFLRTALKKYWIYVMVLTVISILLNPTNLLRIARAIRLMISRFKEKSLASDPSAEILAIGVLPQYRDFKFIHNTGIRISHDLLSYAASFFRKLGLKKMRAVVDSPNTETLLFYRSIGATFEPYERQGESMYQVWIDTNLTHNTKE